MDADLWTDMDCDSVWFMESAVQVRPTQACWVRIRLEPWRLVGVHVRLLCGSVVRVSEPEVPSVGARAQGC